ncbi:bifunctional folylpolyglutamate synthase/dihydrofolate synthase [Rubrolithibacter danxiaensis]|uniref:bifunctional folylpolyglutamate synthase/dihydrofolate synthase n=1 Tax=Rubrolithibacter danxiaensis TaxID=3390805 RepID=UPI003BF7F5CB
MTYSETIEYLYSRLPMFTKLGASAIKKDLTNTRIFCSRLRNPHQKFSSLHIGGTNGKGSVSNMLAAILQVAGYKTGLYTSPHLRDFRERFRINGEMIAETEVVNFTEKHRQDIEEIEPSFFELTVALAFNYFAEQAVDIAVIEVGLGGRLDSTNIISPLLSVITNIGYDHVNLLGNSLEEIAFEKAGIIKANTPVVIGQKQPETTEVFLNKAREEAAKIQFASDNWQIEEVFRKDEETLVVSILSASDLDAKTTYELDLPGTYQAKNLLTVLSAVEELKKQGFKITDEHIKKALKQVKKLTGLQGRWEIISKRPLLVADTGHNEDGIKEVLKNIEATSFEKLHMVIGMVKDKDIAKILSLLPKNANYYFCQPQLERAKPAAELFKEAAAHGLKGQFFSTVDAALEAAKKSASVNDLIFVGGSTFVVAEII